MSLIFSLRHHARIIRLTSERWEHIAAEHPNTSIEDMKATLLNPSKVKPSKYNPENVVYFHRFIKTRKQYHFVAGQ